LLYRQQRLERAASEKERYYYEGGFPQLIADLAQHIPKDSVRYGFTASRVRRENQVWSIFDQKGEEFTEKFDYLVLALDGPAALQLIRVS
jgi:protoporphyrinogen oxidase